MPFENFFFELWQVAVLLWLCVMLFHSSASAVICFCTHWDCLLEMVATVYSSDRGLSFLRWHLMGGKRLRLFMHTTRGQAFHVFAASNVCNEVHNNNHILSDYDLVLSSFILDSTFLDISCLVQFLFLPIFLSLSSLSFLFSFFLGGGV